MYAPKTANIDPAIWPLTEGAHSLEPHEVVHFLTADSRFNLEMAESPTGVSLAVFLRAPCIVQ